MPAERKPGVFLLALSCLAFVSLGLPDGLLGVAWPSIRSSFGLSLDALGPFLIVATAGYVLSSFSSGRILSRVGIGMLLTLSCVATAASLLGYAAAPRWWMMVSLASLAGLGAGAIDAGLNTYVATHHSPRTLNWLHACYGFGAASGPAIMTLVLAAGLPWQRGYAVVGLGQIGLAICFTLTLKHWPAPRPKPVAEVDASGESAPVLDTLRLPLAWAGMAAFFLYTGLEAAFGAWAYTFLTEARGASMHASGTSVSVFWCGLTIGRIGFGLVASAALVDHLLRLTIVSIAAGAALIALTASSTLACIGLALAGVACGPVFPSLIATTPARLGRAHTANAVGFQVAAAALGQSLLPGAVGVLAAAFGPASIGAALLAMALLLIGLHATLVAGATAQSNRTAHLSPAPANE
jgi:fucose permease